MSDPHDPNSPPPAAQPDLFQAPDADRFRAPEPDAYIAPEPVTLTYAAPEPPIDVEPVHALTTVPGIHLVASSGAPETLALLPVSPASSPVAMGQMAGEVPTVAGRIAEEVVAWLKTLASAAVYATLIVTFGFQVARVEGQSMAPTLADQDRLIVNKAAYRFFEEPQIGDIVMLYYPLNPDKSFVKRVIAEEGDTVRVVDGRVYVNDVPMRDDFVPAEYRSHDDWGPQVIPEGYYFVMGDHRNNSSDSRHWGFVPKKYIIGKVQVRWWPVPQARVF
jgi:signal peptidase I